ncbi:DUF2007 domain-containing protein [Luteolibacter marinus]|uniref:putative signal transducing protein n=1 Tax=Luteolibacter marinus TaxID=2776705 RepID=UPI001866CFCA|nr:DUF2007 domain-containing protein [Luteolibacter marinus]
MIELFRNQDKATVGHLQGLLESAGIATFVRNEDLSATAIAITEFAPALCVVDESDVERAVEIIRGYLASRPAEVEEELTCPSCGETSPGTFAECWKCGGPLGK